MQRMHLSRELKEKQLVKTFSNGVRIQDSIRSIDNFLEIFTNVWYIHFLFKPIKYNFKNEK